MNALLPLMHPLAAVEHGGGARAAGVAAGAGLGQPERAERAAGDELGQEAAPSAPRVPKRYTGMAPSETPASSVMATLWSTLAELLEREAEREVVAAHAADLLGERQPEQAHVGHPRDDLVGEGLGRVVLRS